MSGRAGSRLRAFSLLEAIVTTALLGVVLIVLGSLMQTYSRSVNALSAQDRLFEAAQMALLRLTEDISSASRVTVPVTGATSNQLVLERLDRENPGRLQPLPLPHPNPVIAFEPLDPAYQMNVRYSLSGNELWREAAGSQELVANHVEDLEVSRSQDRLLTVRLRITMGDRQISVSGNGFLMVEAP